MRRYMGRAITLRSIILQFFLCKSCSQASPWKFIQLSTAYGVTHANFNVYHLCLVAIIYQSFITM